MVQHWRKSKDPKARHYMLINAVGAIATGITVIVVLVAKFLDGAWITVLLIPLLIMAMLYVKAHFSRVRKEIEDHRAAPYR